MKPVRVAMFIQGYHPLVGGAERQLGAVAPLLQTLGIESHIVTRRYEGMVAFEIIDGVPVHRLPIPGPKPMAAASYTLAALNLLRHLKVDILHAYEFYSPMTTALTAKTLFRKPVVVTAERGGHLGDVYHLKERPLGSQRMDFARRYVDMFVSISREIDAEIAHEGIPDARRTLIPHGVDIQRFAPISGEEQRLLREQLGLPDAPIVIFTGRLAPEKRVNNLIEVWPHVRAIHPEAVLLLLGIGPEEAKLKAMAGAGVRFEGRIEDVAPYLKCADVFTLPSTAEGLSVSSLEAFATGLPVVISDVGGARDVIEDRQSGWLVQPDNLNDLREAFVTLLSDTNLRRRMGQAARQRIVEDFSLRSVAERLRDLYQHLSHAQM